MQTCLHSSRILTRASAYTDFRNNVHTVVTAWTIVDQFLLPLELLMLVLLIEALELLNYNSMLCKGLIYLLRSSICKKYSQITVVNYMHRPCMWLCTQREKNVWCTCRCSQGKSFNNLSNVLYPSIRYNWYAKPSGIFSHFIHGSSLGPTNS